MNIDGKYEVIKFYIRSLSVESPLTGRLPPLINQPNINIDIDPMITWVADNLYEVAARFTVSARTSGSQLYLIELTQAGFFSISQSGGAHKEYLLRRVFPQLIYPAARGNIVSFIVAAGYQPIVLDHIQLENLFTTTPVADKRLPPPAPVPPAPVSPGQADVITPPLKPESPPSRKPARPRAMVLAGAGIIALLLVLLWAGLPQHLTSFTEGHPDQPVVAQTPKVHGGATDQPVILASASAVVQNEVPGLSASQMAQTGSNWLEAQEGDAFTVELLRTEDVKKLADIAPVEEGQPLFLVKLSSAGYAVLSGAYRSEDQAKQAAAKFATYRTMRFKDYR